MVAVAVCFVRFWASSVDALQKGPTPGDSVRVPVNMRPFLLVLGFVVSLPSQKNLRPQRGSELVIRVHC